MKGSILMITVVCSLVTIAIRFFPFVLFRKQTPQWLNYLGKYLPYSVIAMLVVYCLKNVNLFTGNHGFPELIGIVVTAALHLWKKNTLLSVVGGTVCYMLVIQLIF